MRELYDEMSRIHRDGGRAALATVIGTLGSTPGKQTMKMLIRADGSALGSVGGGCVEAEVFSRARGVMDHEKPERFSVDLNEHDNPETGLVCGGRIEIFIEPIVVPNVFVFGAGHVGRALCRLGADTGFRMIVLDDRAEFADASRLPGAAEVLAGPFAETTPGLAIGADAFVVVLTRGHHADLDVLRALWRARARPRYLGLIGSRAKWKTLRGQLDSEGVEHEFLDRVRTPIGLAIGARSAEEIAVSAVAEFIALRRGAADALR